MKPTISISQSAPKSMLLQATMKAPWRGPELIDTKDKGAQTLPPAPTFSGVMVIYRLGLRRGGGVEGSCVAPEARVGRGISMRGAPPERDTAIVLTVNAFSSLSKPAGEGLGRGRIRVVLP